MELVLVGLAFVWLVSRRYHSDTYSDHHVREKPLAQPSELRSRVGQTAIYTENGVASHVHVDHVSCDDMSAEVELTFIPSPGMVTGQATGLVGPTFSVGCCWALLYTRRLGWHCSAQGCSWSLYFDPQLIQEVLQLGASLHGKVDRSERLCALRKRLGQAFVEDCRN